VGPIENLAKEYKDGKLRHFRDLPDILPVRLRPGVSLDPIDYDNISPTQKQQFLDKCEPFTARKVTQTLPIAIIYNPNSGNKTNLLPQIKHRLPTAVIFITEKAFDSFKFANSLDFS
jgi:hypothetical protein